MKERNAMNETKRIILCAISTMGSINVDQLKRFLFDPKIIEPLDIAWPLAELRQEGFLNQTIGETGIQYEITQKGEEALRQEPLIQAKSGQISQNALEYQALFAKERDYPAQYTEQANAIIPVFLSIRKRDKVLFKISVIVHDVETAEKIKRHWMQNAQKAYSQTWECIAEGAPLPLFD